MRRYRTGKARRLAAVTGAPAQARTALSPMARSRVLFPDMLEPLTIHRRMPPPSETSLATASSGGISGWARRRLRRQARAVGSGPGTPPQAVHTQNRRASIAPRIPPPRPSIPRYAVRSECATPQWPSRIAASRSAAPRWREKTDCGRSRSDAPAASAAGYAAKRACLPRRSVWRKRASAGDVKVSRSRRFSSSARSSSSRAGVSTVSATRRTGPRTASPKAISARHRAEEAA